MRQAREMADRGVRRRALRESLHALGGTLSVGAGAALAGVLTDRLIGPGLAWWWIVAPSMGLGLAAGLGLGFARRGTPLAAACEIDRALGLHDRIGSALALERAADADGFVALAIEEGDEASSRVNLARAMPLRLGLGWRAWPALLAPAIAAGIFMPALDLLGEDARTIERRSADARAHEMAHDAITKAIQRTTDPPPGAKVADLTPTGAESGRGGLLDEIRRELESGAATPDEALGRAAGALDNLAGEARQTAEALEAQADATRRALAGIPAPGAGVSDAATDPRAGEEPEGAQPARDLADSLRRGDLDAAERALSELAEQLKAIPDAEDSPALAEELERLAQGLDEAARKAREQADKADRAMSQRLREQGLPPDAATPTPPEATEDRPPNDAESPAKQEPVTTEEIERSLRQRGLDEESAQRMARNLAAEERERAARERAAEQAERLAKAAREAADEAKSPAPEDRPAPPRDQRPQPEGADQSTDQPSSRHQPPSSQPKAPDQPGDAEPDAGTEAPAPSDKPQPEARKEPNKNEPGKASPSPQQQPSDDKGQPQDQPDPKSSPDSSGQDAKPTPTPGAEKPRSEGAQPGARREQGPAPGQTEPEGKTPGATPDTHKRGEEPGPAPKGVDAMRETIERLREDREQAQRSAERSRELEKQAREMLEKMSPEERERLERWAAELERESGKPPTSPAANPPPPDGSPGDAPQGADQPRPGDGAKNDGTPTDGQGPRGDTVGGADAGPRGVPGSDTSSRTAPMDIRRSGEKPRVAGEWTRPLGPDEARDARSKRPMGAREMEELLRDAEKSAEQAVEDQVIPKRYRNVGEYFRKARERAEKKGEPGADNPAVPAPPAKDVEPAPPKPPPK